MGESSPGRLFEPSGRAIAPILEGLAKTYEGRVQVTKLDVDTNQRTSMKFNVRSIPTLLFFKDGKLVDSVVGLTQPRITSYNVCYTKLLRANGGDVVDVDVEAHRGFGSYSLDPAARLVSPDSSSGSREVSYNFV